MLFSPVWYLDSPLVRYLLPVYRSAWHPSLFVPRTCSSLSAEVVIFFKKCYRVLGFARHSEDIEMMLGRKPNIYWKACWMIVTPLVIAITIICNCAEYKAPSMDTGEPEAYYYPDWALALGWLITLFPMGLIVGFFAFRYCKDGGWLVR